MVNQECGSLPIGVTKKFAGGRAVNSGAGRCARTQPEADEQASWGSVAAGPVSMSEVSL